MRILVDTSGLIDQQLTSGNDLGYTPQALRELGCVATRPIEANGLAATPAQVAVMIAGLGSVLSFWDDEPGIASTWRRYVQYLNVSGRQVHDANMAAAAVFHGASHVLTLDRGDFQRYQICGLGLIFPEVV